MKRISVLKPDIRKGIMKNEQADKFTFLSIPENLGINDLKKDIKLGAVHFKELCNTIEKENDSKYVVVTSESLEMGYIAITYLAACYNEKKGKAYEWHDTNDEKTGVEEWLENDFQIPVIDENELIMFNNNNNHSFPIGDVFAQANFFSKPYRPYWVDCTNSSVCVIVREDVDVFGINSGMASDYLDMFNNNERVYILIEKQKEYNNYAWMGDEHNSDTGNEDEWYDDGSKEKTKYIILNYSADDFVVNLEKEYAKSYYTQILKSFFEKNSIKANRGFAYSKIIDIIMAMNENNKCELIEKIVKYAIKDMNPEGTKTITTKDFDFIDRFVKSRIKNNNSKESSAKRMKSELIGMDSVKEQVIDVVNVMRYNKMRAKMNIGGSVYHNVHVMLGAPGTAKTTMAKLMGQMMVENGLLRDNRFVCVNGAELKGKYVGHSAPKTKALFENYDIIVIDEAYSLVDSKGEMDSFSNEAIAQLIIELEEHSTDKLVIFTGYGGKNVTEKNNKMRNFFDANPGIKSRITSTIYFESYSPEEMVNILFNMAKIQKYNVDASVKDVLYTYFCKRVNDENFGNGREARSLLETCILFAAKRLFINEKEKYTKTQMQTLTYDDVVNAINRTVHSMEESKTATKKFIGFSGR